MTLDPNNWVKAEISLDIWGIFQTLTLSFCIIEEVWDENTMTFVNKPIKGLDITDLLITQSGVYKIDISEYIQGRNDVSICVYIHTDDYINDYAYITSREGYISEVYAPQLIWTYETEATNEPAIHGYNIFFLVSIVSITFIIIRKKIKNVRKN